MRREIAVRGVSKKLPEERKIKVGVRRVVEGGEEEDRERWLEGRRGDMA